MSDAMLFCAVLAVQILEISGDKGTPLLDTVNAPQRIRRGVEYIVDQPVKVSGCDMQTGVTGGVVDVDLSIIDNGAVGKYDIADIPYPFFSERGDQVPGRFRDDL